jgi:hypothetical protein
MQNLAKRNGIAGALWAVIILSALLVGVAGCNDEPTKPEPVREVVYYYVYSPLYQLYVLDADSLTVIDSTGGFSDLTEPIEDMVATPDGRWLFSIGESSAQQGDLVRKIDVATLITVDSLRLDKRIGGRSLLLLDGGRLLRIGNCSGLLANVESFPDVTIDSSEICAQAGPIDGKTVAGIVPGTNRVRIETVDPRTVLHEFPGRTVDGSEVSGVHRTLLHPGADRVSLIATANGFWYIIMDVETGEALHQHAVPSGAFAFIPGEIAINSQNTRAVVTVSGNPLIGDFVGTVDVVDLTDFQLLKRYGYDDFGGPTSNSQIGITHAGTEAFVMGVAVWGSVPYRITFSPPFRASNITEPLGVVGALSVGVKDD